MPPWPPTRWKCGFFMSRSSYGSGEEIIHMKYALYFVIGGTVVSLTTYLGSLGKSWLAAFVTTFPALTGITFILMYLNAGVGPTVPYARNLLYFVIPWLAYVGFYLVTIDRLGFWLALTGAIALFVAVSALTKLVV